LEKFVDVTRAVSTQVELDQEDQLQKNRLQKNQRQEDQKDVHLVSMLKEEDVLKTKKDQFQKDNAKKDLSKEEEDVLNKLFTTTLSVQKDTPRKENFVSNPKLHVKEFVLLESDVEEDVQETTNANLVACLNSLPTWLQNVQETKLQNASLDVVLHSTPVFTTEEETVQTNSNHVLLHVEQPRELSKLSKLKLKFHIGLLFKNARELSKWLKK
jgi:hypothetical protein